MYGSYSRGEENENSDIDIMIVSQQFDRDDDKQIGRIWRVTKSFDYRIEPYIIITKNY